MISRILIAGYRMAPPWMRMRGVRLLTPNYTAGVACLVVRPDGRLLLVRQTYRKGWTLPGGLLNRQESPKAAAERELSEELGIRVHAREPHRVAIAPVRQTVTAFCVIAVSDEQVAMMRLDPIEIGAAEWFAVSDLPEMSRDTEPVNDADLDAVATVHANKENQ